MRKLFFLLTTVLFSFLLTHSVSAQVDYGVNIDTTTGDVTGYAWSDAVGWFDFSGVTYNTSTRELEGVAEIIQITSQGGDGTVSLSGDCSPSCGGYGVALTVSNTLEGNAWSDTIGWIEFGPLPYGGVFYNPGSDPNMSGYAWNENIGWIQFSGGTISTVAAPEECTASPFNTCSWAWADTIGWITHNSIDNPSVPVFGADIDEVSGAVTGHAWNDILQYIDFSGATYNPTTGELTGTAEILSWGAGVGDISLSGSCGGACTYGVIVAPDGTVSGHAWNNTIGYIDFAPDFGGVFNDTERDPSLNGWAWNDSYGWISFNFTEYDVEYGVNMEESGEFTGYAWSEIGWINYRPDGPYPSAPTVSARWDQSTETVIGWAEILSIDAAGGDGWILFNGDCSPSCGGFGVKIAQSTGDWSGYAWNNTIGWIMFDHAYGSVHTDFTSSGPATPVLESPNNCDEITDLTPSLNWSDYAALDSSSQQAFEIQVSDNDPFFGAGNLVIDYSTDNPPPAYPGDGSLYTIGLSEQLEYNKVYYWRVRVQSSEGDWSEYGTTGPSGESNCFTTPLHAPPICAFTMNPNPAQLEQPTQFSDESTTFGGSVVAEWDWDFGDGTTLTGSDILVHQDPVHTYSTQEAITVSLTITDSDGYSCSIQESTSVTQSIPEIKRVTPR